MNLYSAVWNHWIQRFNAEWQKTKWNLQIKITDIPRLKLQKGLGWKERRCRNNGGVKLKWISREEILTTEKCALDLFKFRCQWLVNGSRRFVSGKLYLLIFIRWISTWFSSELCRLPMLRWGHGQTLSRTSVLRPDLRRRRPRASTVPSLISIMTSESLWAKLQRHVSQTIWLRCLPIRSTRWKWPRWSHELTAGDFSSTSSHHEESETQSREDSLNIVFYCFAWWGEILILDSFFQVCGLFNYMFLSIVFFWSGVWVGQVWFCCKFVVLFCD